MGSKTNGLKFPARHLEGSRAIARYSLLEILIVGTKTAAYRLNAPLTTRTIDISDTVERVEECILYSAVCTLLTFRYHVVNRGLALTFALTLYGSCPLFAPTLYGSCPILYLHSPCIVRQLPYICTHLVCMAAAELPYICTHLVLQLP